MCKTVTRLFDNIKAPRLNMVFLQRLDDEKRWGR